jgi:aldose 1-epimerase
MGTLRIARAGVEAELAPDRGGALLSLRIGGEDVLRPTDPDAPKDPRGPLETACFPLVPYANRIAEGQFRFDGRTHRVPPNFGDHPHSLHGQGWTSRWDVEKAGHDQVLLSHRHEAGPDWPWAYRAEQKLALIDDGVELSLRVENISNSSMPAGLGFHPYILRTDATRLRFVAKGVWLSPPDLIPDRAADADILGDWGAGAQVAGETLIDNCYFGWDGEAVITVAGGRHLRVSAQGTPYLHVFRPPDEPYFCVEPVTHMPDAINRPEGMDALDPGQSLQITMALTIF